MSHIKNPLTIIAIFAGIAEVSGTGVTPFLSAGEQSLFIWFLMGFPLVLIILFFATLNFNSKVLYAPSDYADENNFLKVNSINLVTQKAKDSFSLITNSTKTVALHKKLVSILVSNFRTAPEFIRLLRKKGYIANIYIEPDKIGESYDALHEYEAIWLGRAVPVDVAVMVIRDAKDFFSHLKYVHLTGDNTDGLPPELRNEIYIGGSTETAKEYGLKSMSDGEFQKLYGSSTIDELHSFVRSFYRKA